MTHIVVISDTHLSPAEIALPGGLEEVLKSADIIVHAGDYTCSAMVQYIKSLGTFYGVHGNMDSGSVKAELPEMLVFEVNGAKIGITHGEKGPDGFIDRVSQKMAKEQCNIVISGHLHNAYIEQRGKTLYFNPGSPTDKRFAKINTYGIIDINEEGAIEPRVVKVGE